MSVMVCIAAIGLREPEHEADGTAESQECPYRLEFLDTTPFNVFCKKLY